MNGDKPLIGFEAIVAAVAGQVQLAAGGVAPADFHEWLGYDDEAVWQAAREAADEEFATLPGLPPGIAAEGRLSRMRSLSRSQRDAVKSALADTFVLAFYSAVSLERARLHEGDGDGHG